MPTAWSACSPSTPARSRSSCTPPRSRRTTGRRASRRPTSASTRTAPSTCSRPRGRTARTRRSSSARPTRSTATRPNRLPLRGPADPAGAAGGPPLLPGHRHVDVDRPLDPLAVRRLEGRRRPARPGVRALLRHAHGLLPRRLPHRPAARGGEAARLPRLPDEVRGHRHAVHRLRLRGQAGPRQHPQRRPGRRVRGVPRGAAAGRRLQHRRRPLLELLDAGGDRGLRADRRAASSSGSWARSPASAITAGGSPTWRRSRPTTRTGRCATASTRSSPRSTSTTSSAGWRPSAERRGPRSRSRLS